MMRAGMASIFTISICLLLSGSLSAQEDQESQPEQAPPPNVCEESPEFDQWDFWLGEWDVFMNDEVGAKIGTNSITKHYADCLIKENWVDARGNGGFSMNFYNPVRKHWRQVWVSNGYFIDYTGGLNDKGQMVLEGESDQYVPNATVGFRGIWTPEDNGDVIQRFEVLDKDAGTWKSVFEARYVRQ